MKQDIYSLISQILIPILVAFITYIIAKRQITNAGVTQFRQNWIDDLREAISIYIAKAEMISTFDFEDDDNYYDQFEELTHMQHKIELMLNPNEADHVEISKIIEEIREVIHEEELNEPLFDKLIKDLMKITKSVLKREWNVVKKGK